jgi:hypothetical protein
MFKVLKLPYTFFKLSWTRQLAFHWQSIHSFLTIGEHTLRGRKFFSDKGWCYKRRLLQWEQVVSFQKFLAFHENLWSHLGRVSEWLIFRVLISFVAQESVILSSLCSCLKLLRERVRNRSTGIIVRKIVPPCFKIPVINSQLVAGGSRGGPYLSR